VKKPIEHEYESIAIAKKNQENRHQAHDSLILPNSTPLMVAA
jgi:hypothetical protein